MMPIRPTARPDRLIRLLARFDLHIRDKSFLLPLGEVLGHSSIDLSLALPILFGDASKEDFAIWTDPLDAVEALLINIILARLEVELLPTPQRVGCDPINLAITTD